MYLPVSLCSSGSGSCRLTASIGSQKGYPCCANSGVKHIFYSSLGFAGDYTSTVAHVMGVHLETERFLADLPSIMTYTIIREGLYSESFPSYTNRSHLQLPVSEIKIAHDGSGPGVAWVKRDELAEATANLVARYATATGGNPAKKSESGYPYVNKIVLLTGPKVFSLRETAEVWGRVVGKDVRITLVTVDE
ncbi:hypothetical protein BJX63DRAFT_401792 [Aspergillus granulosus]|uniref:NmrA-like domain-containing protein n=1 Tax=Aspergillus granulosus TaxID=176169 RepID=A0ABR4H517_9EURO